VVDPTAEATQTPQRKSAALRIGVLQADLRFIARHTELRETIDVLSGRTDVRLLVISGSAGALDWTKLLDRALEELDPEIARLYISAQVLLKEDEPLRELARAVTEVAGDAGVKVRTRGKRTYEQWWSLILEDLTTTPFALVLDHADLLKEDHPVMIALAELSQRRSNTRVAITRASGRGSPFKGLAPQQWRAITLAPMSWQETWQWIRRQLPTLTRLGEDRLLPFFADLGGQLENWERLATLLTQGADAVDDSSLREMVRRLAGEQTDSQRTPPPLFGKQAEPTAPMVRPLKVAVTGPHTSGRNLEFARSITRMAAEFGLAGRIVQENAVDANSALAQLLPTVSVFHDGHADQAEIVSWLDQVLSDGVDILVLDFGSSAESLIFRDCIEDIRAIEVLVVAAGGNSNEPTYPAWYPEILAVGALDDDEVPAAFSRYFTDAKKPDIYAVKSLKGTPLAGWVTEPDAEGTSYSALYVAAAAVLVWATYRTLSADDVRGILLKTAATVPSDALQPVRRLDLPEALYWTRCQLMLDVLERGPMATGQLLAESGLPSSVALPALDRMIQQGRLVIRSEGSSQQYENPRAIYRQYEQSRKELPSGDNRTSKLEALVGHARGLAQRGQLTKADVDELWGSDQPGPRIVAIAVMQELPAARDWLKVKAAISHSLSAFEQYHALALAREMVKDLDLREQKELRAAIEEQKVGYVRQGTGRRRVADEIIRVLDEKTEAPDESKSHTYTERAR
jgi:hypothetical protein